MKKEQLLLVAAAGISGLVVWMNSGLYARVGADKVGEGSDLDVRATVPANPREGLLRDTVAGRNLLRQTRVERRKPREEIEAPPSIGTPWVRPLPMPELPPSHWGIAREEMKPVARPEKKDETAAAAPAETEEGIEDPAILAAREKEAEEKAARARIESAANIVLKNGTKMACRLTPLGADQGQPVWVILEKWPNVRFLVEELNPDGRTVRGRYEFTPAEAERYQTVHLEKTLENEYNEERIRRGVREGDRQLNIDFGAWIRATLTPKYGVPAVRLALTHLRAAAAQQMDPQLIAQIGDTCQEAYDLDEEVKSYQAYLTGSRANDAVVVVRLGDAYERGGALHAAKEQFEAAAKLGDVEGRLRLAAVMLQLAEGPADVEAAYAEYERCTTATGPAQKARALAGMARVRILQGQIAQAAQLAADARTADGGSFDALMALGTAQYLSGKNADAEATFKAAQASERNGGTRARSNRAMALLAQGKLPEAIAEAEACLAADPLNYFDPLVVIGEAHQRWGDVQRANDTFQTAALRNPRSPWVLLRLASSRLRDGVPKSALELVLGREGYAGLLQIAPESVDALHVAGIACASQDPPDWAGAVKYLRRALDKDEKNAEVVYDLARVLQDSGRSEEAIAVLESATNANTGFARNDGRVLAMLSWVYYVAGKPVDLTFQTLNRVRTATQAPWTKDWVDRNYQAIYNWDRTRIAEDDFRRAAGERIGNGWEKVDNLGVRVSLQGEMLSMVGSAIPASERARSTGIYRVEDLSQLQAAEFAIRAEPGFEFVAHVYQGELPSTTATPGKRGRSTSAEIGLGRDRTGKMTLYVYTGDNKQFNVPVRNADGTDRAWPTDGEFHRIQFRRTGPASKGEFEILFDDEKVVTSEPVEVGALSAAQGRTCFVGVHLDADQGAKVDLQVDWIKIEKILGKR